MTGDVDRAEVLEPNERLVGPCVQAFFDEPTFTVSYLVHDPQTRRAAIIDSVLDYDPAAGRTSTRSADKIIAAVEQQSLTVDWLLETHAHADHLSAAPYLKERVGGLICIGEQIVRVQQVLAKIFNTGSDFKPDGSDFDRLFREGELFRIGNLECCVLHVPGHTPADVAYRIGGAVFVGDTLFMPDYGTARADFPGGDARALYHSIRRLLELPGDTRLYLCHDYLPEGRADYRWDTTVAEQRRSNVHIHDRVSEDEFVAMRTARDTTLAMPRLILPAIQVNIRAGRLPPAEDNGVTYLKIPVNAL